MHLVGTLRHRIVQPDDPYPQLEQEAFPTSQVLGLDGQAKAESKWQEGLLENLDQRLLSLPSVDK